MAGKEYELHLQKEDVKQEIRRELKIKEGKLSNVSWHSYECIKTCITIILIFSGCLSVEMIAIVIVIGVVF